jgi:hypothetical protein
MHISRYHAILLTITILAAVCASAFAADKITLNTGEIIKGKIISETETSVRIEVPMNKSGSICKSKTIQQADIESISRRSASEMLEDEMETAYKKTQRYKLKSSRSSAVSYYDKTITGVFSNFITCYPESPHVKAVEDEIAKWQEERNTVASGKLKQGGKWITGQQAALLTEVARVEALVDDFEKLVTARNYTNALAQTKSLDQQTARLVQSCAATACKDDAKAVRVNLYRNWVRALEGRDPQIHKLIILNQRRVASLEKRQVSTKKKIDQLSVGKNRHSDASKKKRNACMQSMMKDRDAAMQCQNQVIALKAEQIRLKQTIADMKAAYEKVKKE